MSESVETPQKEVICCCFSKKAKEPTISSTNTQKTEAEPTLARLPFSTDLPKDLRTGQVICVTGIVLPKCSRFVVNLTCGRSPTADVAFHLNPRLLQRYVVRNSRLNGQWGNEERTSTVKFPFGRDNSKFSLAIFVGEEEFYVSVNGVHLCTYKFRVPLEKITGITIENYVDVIGVEYKELQRYPEVLDGITSVRTSREADDSESKIIKTGQDTPVTFLLPEGFQRNCQLEIYGRVKILPHSFYVNLQEGAQSWPHPEIPLHLNPRFRTVSGEPLFVRNAWIHKGWGREERTPGFQFEPGSPFTMAIRRGNDHFSVWIDGKLAGEFKFRGKVDNIDTVHIEGDVVIFDVRFSENSNELAPSVVPN